MTCIGKDPRCPCQDGDACHYKDCVGTKARPPAQPEQEPVALVIDGVLVKSELPEKYTGHLYTTPSAAQWDKPSASFDEWWDSDVMPSANPFAEGSAAYWAWAGWQAAQRQWVGLTDEEILRADPWEILRADPWMGPSDSNINPYQILLKVRTLEAKLKERNA